MKSHLTFLRGHWWHVSGVGWVWSFPLACLKGAEVIRGLIREEELRLGALKGKR